MDAFRRAALFRIVLTFVVGIYLGKYSSQSGIIMCGLLLFSFALVAKYLRSLGSLWRENLFNVILYSSWIWLGSFYWMLSTSNSGQSIDYINCQKGVLISKVISEVKERDYGKTCWVESISFLPDNQEQWLSVDGKLLLRIPSQDTTLLARHDTLVSRVSIDNVRSRYPSYINYLADQNIFHSAYSYSFYVKGTDRSLVYYAERIQEFLANKLKELLPAEPALGIAQAMFLGKKDNLSAETREIFTAAGASHVLAISGLHVGVLYLLLNYLFSFMHLWQGGNRFKNILVLLFLLAFMIITGATPSVNRAVLMFGLLLIFKIFYLRYEVLNVLALSALLQLLFDPFIAYQLSFKLSYLAVCGIVLLYPYFEKSVASEWKWLNHVYSWIGICLAATLFTLPIVLYYFGRFPTYFLLTNVLISVLSSILVMVGFLLVIFSSVPYVNEILAWVCNFLIEKLYYICEGIRKLPFSVIDEDNFGLYTMSILTLELVITAIFLGIPYFHRLFQSRIEPPKQ